MSISLSGWILYSLLRIMAAWPTVLHVLCSCSWSIITYFFRSILLLYTEVENLDTSRKNIVNFITKIRIAIAACQAGDEAYGWKKVHMYKFLHGLLEALSKLLMGLSCFFTPLFLLTAGHCIAMGAKVMKTTGEGGLHMGTGKRKSELPGSAHISRHGFSSIFSLESLFYPVQGLQEPWAGHPNLTQVSISGLQENSQHLPLPCPAASSISCSGVALLTSVNPSSEAMVIISWPCNC